MVRLAIAGALGFSDAPLRLAIWLGLSVSAFAVLYGAYVIGEWFVDRDLVTGWASTIVVISFLSGINLLMTGLMGLYVGRIHAEVKRRPLYVIDARVGFDRAASASALPPSRRHLDQRSSVG
jgi:dolichol-phosphate mannosyltransferase